MKKNLKRNFKRWIAFLLAVVLIVTTCVYSSDAHLRAADGEENTEVPSEEQSGESEEQSNESEDPIVFVTPTERDEDNSDLDEEFVSTDNSNTTEKPSGEVTETEDDVIVSPEEEKTTESPAGGTSGEGTTVPEESSNDQNVYGYVVYFYYGETGSKTVEGKGALGDLILKDIKIEDTVDYEGQSYSWVETVGAERTITEKEEENTVKVVYNLAEDNNQSGNNDQSSEGAEEEKKTYTLSFENDPEAGGEVKVVSVNGEEAGAQDAYTAGTEVAFEISVNEGYEVSSVKAGDETLKKASDDEEVYTVTVEDNTTVTVAYEEVKLVVRKNNKLKVPKSGDEVGNPNASHTYTIIFWEIDDVNGHHELQRITVTELGVTLRELTSVNGQEIKEGEVNRFWVVDGTDLAEQDYPEISIGKKNYVCKGGSFDADNKGGNEGKHYNGSFSAGKERYLVLQNEADRNIINIYYVFSGEVRNEVSIKFDTDGGTPQPADRTGEAGLSNPNRIMPEVSKDGYEFLGWYDSKEGGNLISELPLLFPNEDTIYYAK